MSSSDSQANPSAFGDADVVEGNAQAGGATPAVAPRVNGQTVPLMTITIDKGNYKTTITSTDESVHYMIEYDIDGLKGTDQGLWKRGDAPKTNTLLAGIDAFTKQLLVRIMATRGENAA